MVDRVLMGKFPDGGYGLRVSEPNYNVNSNPIDNERLIFNSDWSSLNPVILRGSATVSARGQQYVNFGFTLPYVPVFFSSKRSHWDYNFDFFYVSAEKERLYVYNNFHSPVTFSFLVFKTQAFV